MKLSKILAVSGKPGLYKMLAQNKNGFIVESVTDGKRFPVFAHERVSSLEEISIFTEDEEDLQLGEIFKIMFEKHDGQKAIDAKSDNAALKAYFEEIIPSYDKDRVYVSDMKKLVVWYNLLAENDLLDFSEEEEEEKAEGEVENKATDEDIQQDAEEQKE